MFYRVLILYVKIRVFKYRKPILCDVKMLLGTGVKFNYSVNVEKYGTQGTF